MTKDCSFRATCLLSTILVILRKMLQQSGHSGHTHIVNLTSHFSALFQKWQIFGAPQLYSWRTCAHQVFCGKLNFIQFLFEAFFSTISILQQRSAIKGVNFPIPVLYNISKIAIFGGPELHSWGRQRYAFSEFFVGNLNPNNSCLRHFLISLVFFVSFSPKVNVLFHSSALKYLKMAIFWGSLAPLQRDIETCVH